MLDTSQEQYLGQRIASITSYGRLHFGLVEIAAGQPHRFGGIGLMVEDSVTRVDIVRGSEPTALSENRSSDLSLQTGEAYWFERIQQQLLLWKLDRELHGRFCLKFHDLPQPHCGLGSGTQIACTVVSAILAATYCETVLPLEGGPRIEQLLSNDCKPTGLSAIEHLSQLSQRGKRSNVGLYGFLHGGLVFDYGQHAMLSPMLRNAMRVEFPSEWPIVLVQSTAPGISGKEEICFFDQCSSTPNVNRERMLSLISEVLIPSANARDWNSFGKALGDYGRMAGEVFHRVQQGTYRTPAIAEQVEFLCQIGLESACQSSWGPTVCAVAQNDEHAQWAVKQLCGRFDQATSKVVRAINQPAQLEWA